MDSSFQSNLQAFEPGIGAFPDREARTYGIEDEERSFAIRVDVLPVPPVNKIAILRMGNV